ncbi:hypothetical protein SAMN05216232_2158 [Virgibacillus subterraneus]|uniref:Uncharacterized protein n=2 Tax=Virgibacillus TaxID=84406 RepID=A0A1H1BYX2_9BACI|nr:MULTISPECIES: hypothetical protein [Virgibacillus]SDQ56970.1 hypothetical protein SAMN05216231_1979 [Virgibacillus salinus]SEQ29394.1 hypothetical protein SAMN05216232_2158 [Virgibacillus subterraneus]
MRSIKIMLLGIAIMIVVLYLEENSSIVPGDGEFFIMIIGILITVIGLFKKDKFGKV